MADLSRHRELNNLAKIIHSKCQGQDSKPIQQFDSRGLLLSTILFWGHLVNLNLHLDPTWHDVYSSQVILSEDKL